MGVALFRGKMGMLRFHSLLVGIVLWTLFSSTSFAKQMVLPNTGFNSPPGYIGQTSELGQGPSNPSTYYRPNVTPPTWFQRDSCTPGILGTLNADSGASVSDMDFNSSFRCFSHVAPELVPTPESQAPGQAAQGQSVSAQPENSAGQEPGRAAEEATPKNPVPAPIPLQKMGDAPLQPRAPSNLNSGLNNVPGIGDYRYQGGEMSETNDGLGSNSGAVGGTNLQ